MRRIGIKHYARWTPAGAQLTHMSIHSNDSRQVSGTEIKVTSSSTWLKLIWVKEVLVPGGDIRERHFEKVYILIDTKLIKTSRLSVVVMNHPSFCWMINYSECSCPLIWLISSGQMFDRLIRHFRQRTRFACTSFPSLTALQRSLAAVFWLQNVGFKLWASLFNAFWLNGPTTPGWKDNISIAEVLLKAPRMNLCAVWENLCNQRLTTQIQYVMVSMDAR